MALLSIHKGFRNLIANGTGISALVSSRIYVGRAPETAAMPLMIIERDGASFHHNMAGAATLREKTQRVAIYADDYADIESITDAVMTTVDGYKGTQTISSDSVTFDSIMATSEKDETLETENGEGEAGVLYSRELVFTVRAYTE